MYFVVCSFIVLVYIVVNKYIFLLWLTLF